MTAYLIRRLWQMIPTLIGVVLLVFFLFKYFGGDPAEILGGLSANAQQIEAIRDQLGLNKSTWEQLYIFFKQIVTFDWGRSWATNESVANLFATRLPATLTVMVPILLLDVLLAIPFALAVAYVRGSLTDRAIMVVSTVALSISFLVYVIVEKEAAVEAGLRGHADHHRQQHRQGRIHCQVGQHAVAPALDRKPAEAKREQVLADDHVDEERDR